MADIVDIRDGDRRRRERERPRGRSKTALVLTGGGVVGGVYQIGALRALDLLGVDITVNDFDIYVGTSCGAFINSLIANGARPEDLMALLDGADLPGYEPLELDRLLKPNTKGIADSAVKFPMRAAAIMRDIALNIGRLSISDVFTMLTELAPSGFYSLDAMKELLERQLGRDGFTNDFRELARELYIVATDLDTCEPVVFGEAGWDDVPIATATAASASLPLIYTGVNIRGREFADGGLRSFSNVETAVEKGATFVIIVNPIVPYDNDRFRSDGARHRPVSEMGPSAVAAQMFKSLVWSAMHERLNHWRTKHPDVDFILIEPRRDDELMFSTQIMNVSQRVQIAKHGFESVTEQLSSDFDYYRDTCARHGITISRRGVIEMMEETRTGAPSGTTRWKRILERGASGRQGTGR